MKLTIGVKILLGFGLALLIQCVVSVVSYSTVSKLVDNTYGPLGVTHTYEVLRKLERLLSLLKDAETGQRGYLLVGKKEYLEPYNAGVSDLRSLLAEVRRLTSRNPGQQERLDRLGPLIEEKLAELKETIDLYDPKDPEKALTVVRSDRGKKIMDRIRTVIDEMKAEEDRLLGEREAASRQAASLAFNTLFYGTALAFVLVAAAGVLIQRSITVPLAGFMKFVEQVGQGDLSKETPSSGSDEVGLLGGMLNGMVLGLRDLSRQVRSASENLNSAAAEIQASVQEQATGTREQAAAIQQITTTVEEVNQAGIQIAEKAREVASSAEAASSSSTVGLQAMQTVARGVQEIRNQVEAFAEHITLLSEKTQAVGEIITAVTDIAERSNLLALNAAIEAAGAGEHGARFAVVANEMKSLADQAKESTVQVQTILVDIQKGISNSVMLTEEAVKRAEAGSTQAETSELVIHQLAESTRASVHAFQQIIASTGQQQIGFDQVTQGMKDIRQAAEQTAQATAQLEMAVANVSALGRQLQTAVGKYRL
jgi:methyl-accepting chemotaxis protein